MDPGGRGVHSWGEIMFRMTFRPGYPPFPEVSPDTEPEADLPCAAFLHAGMGGS
ncbi:hypothetical protein SAMN04489742_0298 [Arthrobacter crystallopoietes]|uniref:Uncharacterized protein n=1 Tax=Crystallibacter crystallopoietes TaxID=37928 RepID=A0A1H0ZDW5_9MICC|nr:hypothetical protein SAMN04489742_0298 [Arthrobacter crystallopoietes]